MANVVNVVQYANIDLSLSEPFLNMATHSFHGS